MPTHTHTHTYARVMKLMLDKMLWEMVLMSFSSGGMTLAAL